MEKKIAELKMYQRKLRAYSHAMNLLHYDAATGAMPSGGAETMSATMEILAGELYKLTTDEALGTVVDALFEERANLDFQTRREVEEIHEDREKMKKFTGEEIMEMQKAVADGQIVWEKAKNANDYAMFMPSLKKLIEMKTRYAKRIAPDADVYDTLLNEFEKGVNRKTLDAFFAELRKEIVPVIKAVTASENKPDERCLHGQFAVEKQKQLSDTIMGVIGLDKAHCSLRETEHPFTMELSKDDVRITTKYSVEEVMSNLFSVVHEGGHAMYELDVDDALRDSVLGHGTSMAMHESQSRLWENNIGRSRAFCDMLLPIVRDLFPENFASVTEEEFYRAVNTAQPSLIRTEADELTYTMHIMVRYEMEKAIFDGSVQVEDLPAAWNRLYKEYLGVDVPDDRSGILQDCHWGSGDFGYFPSYALGTAYAAQIIRELEKDVSIEKCCAEKNFMPVRNWLTEKIHRFGMLYTSRELLPKVCGAEFDPSIYTNYLKKKFSALYGIA